MSDKLLALDLSISCTGLCIFDIESGTLLKHSIIPIKPATKKAYKGVYQIGIEEEKYVAFSCDPPKFVFTANSLLTFLAPYAKDIKWIAKEAYAFGGASLSRLAEQTGVVFNQLWDHEILTCNNLITVAPASVKKYATGKGKVTKKEVMEAVENRWKIPTDYWYSDDDCDAFVIGKLALMVLNNSPENKYEKELRQRVIKTNNLIL
jgi:Holliday junction resolvasome RuvABC endonuclease subunit